MLTVAQGMSGLSAVAFIAHFEKFYSAGFPALWWQHLMLPVGITLITLTSDDQKAVRGLAAVLLFSISYGCSVAGIGTPSGMLRISTQGTEWTSCQT